MAAPDDTDEAREPLARVGRLLRDKWHLDALIDVGGMAAVYAATHRNGMRGAVKILHRRSSLDPSVAARFRREGYIANKVDHPNAVQVLDDDVDTDGSAFLVMELLSGSTLGERADRHGGTLAPDAVLLAVDQLLDVLAVAHDAAIIHRDVKPENVFVTTDGRVKLLDFGIARLCESSSLARAETIAGLTLGSPAFMSPEQARGRWDLVDAQSDLWSVGAAMFALLSGQDVHSADTVPELLAAIFTRPARSLAVAVPTAHPALVDVVDRALQLRLADRWPDARTMQAAVRGAYLAMNGAAISTGSLVGSLTPSPTASLSASASAPARSAALDEVVREAPAPRAAVTVVALEGRRQRVPRRLALALASALAFAIAAGLGIAGGERVSGSQEPSRSSEPRVRMEGASALLSGSMPQLIVPQSASTPVVHPPPAVAVSAPGPAPRVRRPTVYDRRY
jgi:hypothetical protein